VDEVRGIAPAIAIRQKNSTRNPRSTVGTQTEIFDYLRLLYARVGITYCRVCGREVYKDSPESVADEILRTLPRERDSMFCFPRERGWHRVETREKDTQVFAFACLRVRASGHYPAQTITAHLMSLMQRGFTRLFSAGRIIDLHSPDDYQLNTFDDVFVMVDRLVAGPDIRQRLVDSLEICFQEGHGTANIETAEPEPTRLKFSDRFECKYDGTIYTPTRTAPFQFQ
jgi:excinuclease ABC subunit A